MNTIDSSPLLINTNSKHEQDTAPAATWARKWININMKASITRLTAFVTILLASGFFEVTTNTAHGDAIGRISGRARISPEGTCLFDHANEIGGRKLQMSCRASFNKTKFKPQVSFFYKELGLVEKPACQVSAEGRDLKFETVSYPTHTDIYLGDFLKSKLEIKFYHVWWVLTPRLTIAVGCDVRIPPRRLVTFGTPGATGKQGLQGPPGPVGQDTLLEIEGPQQKEVNAPGGTGGQGLAGEAGGNATNCRLPNSPIRARFSGAQGGKGGMGGRGGSGGAGGGVTVVTPSLDNLKNLLLVVPGGPGGPSGMGGIGGQGCACPEGTRDICTKGPRGPMGKSGMTGPQGQPGWLRVVQVPRKSPLEVKTRIIPLGDLSKEPYPFWFEDWVQKPGSLTYLREGSIINDRFWVLNGHVEKSISTKWLSSRNPIEFAGEKLTITFGRDGFQAMLNPKLPFRLAVNNVTNVISIFDQLPSGAKPTPPSPEPDPIPSTGKVADQLAVAGGKTWQRVKYQIYQPLNEGYKRLPGEWIDLHGGHNQRVYAIERYTHVIHKFENGKFVPTDMVPKAAKRVFTNSQDLMLIIDQQNRVWYYSPRRFKWNYLFMEAKDLSIGPNRDLWVVDNATDEIYWWDNYKWYNTYITAQSLTVTTKDVWYLDPDGLLKKMVKATKETSNPFGEFMWVGYKSPNEVFAITPTEEVKVLK